MTAADVTSIFFAILGFLLSLQGLWLSCRALWPNKVIASATRCGRNPLKSLLAGVIVTLAMIVGSAVVAKAGAPGQVLAFAWVSVYVVFSGVGVAGLATHMGQRLSSPADDRRPWAATVRGGVVLELAYLVPVVGWFVILPASMVLGAGAATLTLLWPRTVRVAAAPLPTTMPTTAATAGGYAPPLPAPYAPAGRAQQAPEVLR